VPIGQRETYRWRGMVEVHSIELPAYPTVERMARFARGREISAHVVWYVPAHRLRLLIILQVTRDTSGGEPLELANRRALVTIVALHGRVRSQQRKTVLVILHLLYGHIPALHRVTLRAIRPHLAPMHVGVAVLTIFGYIGENRFHMALRALHFLVHATQRIVSLVVVELRNRTDRPPSRCGVAILARNREFPVRTSCGFLPLVRRKVGAACGPRENNDPENENETP
jgi:hypothetical protein